MPVHSSRVELLDEESLLFVGAEMLDHGAGAAGQHEGQRQRNIGAVEELVDRSPDRLGQAHAAELRAREQADPAAFADGVVDRLEGLGQGDFAVGVLGADPVAVLVAGRQLFLGDFQALVEHHLDVFSIPIGVFLRLEKFVELEPLEELKLDITQIYFVIHSRPPGRR